VAFYFCSMEALDDSDFDDEEFNSEEEVDVEETVLGEPNFETVGYFDLLSLQEFTRAISKRAAMISVGSEPCLPKQRINNVLQKLKDTQSGEMLYWSEALSLSEWLNKTLPIKIKSLGRQLDPNTAELSFRPLRDHVLSQKLSWLWDEFKCE
jgi:hypothetical protein